MTEVSRVVTASADWTDPGAFAVADDVHRIPLPLPMDALKAVNVYTVQTAGGLVLIDSGWARSGTRAVLEEGLTQIGATLRDVTRCFVTHFHKDHYTHAIALRRDLGIPVVLGRGDQASVATSGDETSMSLAGQLRQLVSCGAEPVVRRLRDAGFGAGMESSFYEAPDEWLDGRTRIDLGNRLLEAVPTPGHTQGHMVFADIANGVLFAGDHVLPHITPSIGFESAPAESPLADYLASLEVVRALPDLRLLPAHGPVVGGTHARVDELLAHHRQRLSLCDDLVRSGLSTAYEVAREVPWTRRNRRFVDLDPFNQMLATIETLAHLRVSVAQGRLRVTDDGGVLRFAA
jgi:glyoxylase-like metal-dependent hydrolase (beta-lactamase superfamily II)